MWHCALSALSCFRLRRPSTTRECTHDLSLRLLSLSVHHTLHPAPLAQPHGVIEAFCGFCGRVFGQGAWPARAPCLCDRGRACVSGLAHPLTGDVGLVSWRLSLKDLSRWPYVLDGRGSRAQGIRHRSALPQQPLEGQKRRLGGNGHDAGATTQARTSPRISCPKLRAPRSPSPTSSSQIVGAAIFAWHRHKRVSVSGGETGA